MKAAFTICANNYLAKAKIVADTFLIYHPEFKFFIVLVDTMDSVDYSFLGECNIIQADKIIDNILVLAKQYNIIELSTSIKPKCFQYFFDTYSFENICYLDPDLMIFSEFTEVQQSLEGNNIVITPHFLTPIDDGMYPSDKDFISFGIYNLGFIAIKNTLESKRFLFWWHERLMKYCFIEPSKGMFTDQLWMNYVAVYFKNVCILLHPGYNVANWNFYERQLVKDKFVIFNNEKSPLRFIHFSSYDFNNPKNIAKHQNRYSFHDRIDLHYAYGLYYSSLIGNNQEYYSIIINFYQEIYENIKKERLAAIDKEFYTFKRKVINRINNIMDKVIP